MHIYACEGKLIPKRGQYKFLISPVGREVCDLLASEDNPVLNIAEYPYTRMDWRGCPNILFTTTQPTYERGNIIVMFCINLVSYFYVLFNAHVIYYNICFNYLIIIIYCFAYIGTYVGDEPPQHEDEVMEEAEDQSLVQRPHMPCRSD
jgi:hypothetical protein